MDSYGAVHSVIELQSDEVTGNIHQLLFPDKPHIRLKWRYDAYRDDLTWDTGSYEPIEDEVTKVRDHLHRIIDDVRNYL